MIDTTPTPLDLEIVAALPYDDSTIPTAVGLIELTRRLATEYPETPVGEITGKVRDRVLNRAVMVTAEVRRAAAQRLITEARRLPHNVIEGWQRGWALPVTEFMRVDGELQAELAVIGDAVAGLRRWAENQKTRKRPAA